MQIIAEVMVTIYLVLRTCAGVRRYPSLMHAKRDRTHDGFSHGRHILAQRRHPWIIHLQALCFYWVHHWPKVGMRTLLISGNGGAVFVPSRPSVTPVLYWDWHHWLYIMQSDWPLRTRLRACIEIGYRLCSPADPCAPTQECGIFVVKLNEDDMIDLNTFRIFLTWVVCGDLERVEELYWGSVEKWGGANGEALLSYRQAQFICRTTSKAMQTSRSLGPPKSNKSN